jgi:hypothetical protein
VLRTLLIVIGVVAVILGGLLSLRSSGRAGLPDEEVLKRAQKKADAERGPGRGD